MNLTIQDCRPEVQTFAVAMEQKLRANDHKGGWRGCDPGYLLTRLGEEVDELARAATSGPEFERKDVLDEAADVANFAMMIADVFGGLEERADVRAFLGEE